MEIGPLEYVVIGFKENHFTDGILPVLNAIQQTRAVRVVDLLIVQKDEATSAGGSSAGHATLESSDRKLL